MISTSFNLQQQPLCILASPGSCIYVIYPKLVVTYAQSVKTAQFILNQPIKLCSLYQYTLFIAYESGKLQKRDLFSWQDPLELGFFEGVSKIKSDNQNQVIVIVNQQLLLIQIDVVNNNRINIRKFVFENQNRIIDLCSKQQIDVEQQENVHVIFVLQTGNQVSKYTLISNVKPKQDNLLTSMVIQQDYTLKSMIVPGPDIINISLINFNLEAIMGTSTRQYLMLVTRVGDINFFLDAALNFIHKLKLNLKQLIQKPHLIPVSSTVLRVHYNTQSRILYVQTKDMLYSLLLSSKQIFAVLPFVNHFVYGAQMLREIEGDLVCSNKQGPVFQNEFKINQMKIKHMQENEQQKDQQEDSMKSIKKEKEKIVEEMQNYSKKMYEAWEKMPADPLDIYQNGDEGDDDVEEIPQEFSIDSQQRIEMEIVMEVEREMKKMEEFRKLLQKQKQELEFEREREMISKIEKDRETQKQPDVEKEIVVKEAQLQKEPIIQKPQEFKIKPNVQQQPSVQIEIEQQRQRSGSDDFNQLNKEIFNHKPFDTESANESDWESRSRTESMPSQKQASQQQKIYSSIQTQTDEYFPFELSQIEQQIQNKIQKFVEIISQQMQQYHIKIQTDIAHFKKKTNTMIQNLIKNQIPKEIKSYLNDFLISKIQKYVSSTFNKLKQIIEIGNNHNYQQLNKQKLKDQQITTHIIDKNKQILDKIMQVVKISVVKFDDKKQEMVSDLETKSNLLNDLTLQVEQLLKKFEDQMKLSSKVEFETKIETLVVNIQETKVLIKARLEVPPLPTILQTGQSHLGSPRKSQIQEHNNPYYQHNSSYYPPPPQYSYYNNYPSHSNYSNFYHSPQQYSFPQQYPLLQQQQLTPQNHQPFGTHQQYQQPHPNNYHTHTEGNKQEYNPPSQYQQLQQQQPLPQYQQHHYQQQQQRKSQYQQLHHESPSPHSNNSQLMNTSVTYPVTYPPHNQQQSHPPINYPNQNPLNHQNQSHNNTHLANSNQIPLHHHQLHRSSTIHSIPESFVQPQLYRQYSNPQTEISQLGFLKNSSQSINKSKLSGR